MNIVHALAWIKSAFLWIGGFAGIGVLVAWIFSLRKTNAEVAEIKARTEKIRIEIDALRKQNEELRRAELVSNVADQIDELQRRAQAKNPAPILIPEELWVAAFTGEQPPEIVRDALRLRRSRAPSEQLVARFRGRFV